MSNKTLSSRVISTRLAVPLNTPIASAISQTIDLGYVIIDWVEVRIPSGHLGFTGFALDNADVRLVPWNNRNEWLIGDNDLLDYEISMEASATMRMRGYNTGSFNHTFYLRFGVSDISPSGARSRTLLVPS